MATSATPSSAVIREAEQADRAIARSDRLRALAGRADSSEDLARRLDEEAREILDDAGAVRLSVARDVLGISDSTLREWVGAGLLPAVDGRPARIPLVAVVGARDALASAAATGADRRRALTLAVSSPVSALGAETGIGRELLVDWIRRGLLRAKIADDGSIRLDERERLYLESHSELLRALDEAAGRDPAADLVVLFGSAARGDDGPYSDVDLVVHRSDGATSERIMVECKSWLGRPVEAVELDALTGQASLLAAVLDEGRVVRDATGAWARLLGQRPQIERAAELEHQDLSARARNAIDELKAPA